MLLLENAEVVLFSSSITLYKVYHSSDSDLWHILDAKDLRMTGALAIALVYEQREGTERRNRAMEQSESIKSPAGVTGGLWSQTGGQV